MNAAAGEQVVVFRSRAPLLVNAARQPDGSVLVMSHNGDGERVLAAEEFSRLFEPAVTADLRAAAAIAHGNGTTPAAPPQILIGSGSPPAKTKRPGRKAKPVARATKVRQGVRRGRANAPPPELIERAKQLWLTSPDSTKALAKQLSTADRKVTVSAIYNWSSKLKWPTRGAGKPKDAGHSTGSVSATPRAPAAAVTKPSPFAAPSPKTDWARGRQLYDQGKSTKEIAKALGVTTSAVYLHAKEWPVRVKPALGDPAPPRQGWSFAGG